MLPGIRVAHVLNVPYRDFLDTGFLLDPGASAECRRGTQSACATLSLQAARVAPVQAYCAFSIGALKGTDIRSISLKSAAFSGSPTRL